MARLEQLLEGGETGVFCRSMRRARTRFEELRDRRQVLAQRSVLVGEIEAGRLLKFGERAAVDPAGVEAADRTGAAPPLA